MGSDIEVLMSYGILCLLTSANYSGGIIADCIVTKNTPNESIKITISTNGDRCTRY